MATKKYVSLSKLSDFLENLKAVFAYKTHTHSMSDISDYTVDSELSSTSTNPVQNKVIDAEFEAISQALNVYDLALNDKANVSDVEELSALVGDTSVAEQISEAIAEIPEQTQANWAQNDETAVDYVKNRTHYENCVYTEVGNVDASVVTWMDDAHYEDTKRCTMISSDATTVFNKQFDTFVIGETYRVIINGVEYETTAYSGSVLGNPLFLTGTVDTEEDFCIYKMLPFSVDVFLRGVEDLPESISLSVDSVTEEVVQLDEKYIPDTIARVPTEDDALALVVEMGLVSPTVADDGSIYTDENGVIYTL